MGASMLAPLSLTLWERGDPDSFCMAGRIAEVISIEAR